MPRFSATMRTASHLMLRHGCARRPVTDSRSPNRDTLGDHSAREVLAKVQELLTPVDPTGTQRLTELLKTRVIVQVPRYCFPSSNGIQELFLVLQPPRPMASSVFVLAVNNDDTLAFGRTRIAEDYLKAVRTPRAIHSPSASNLGAGLLTGGHTLGHNDMHNDDPQDALHLLMSRYGARLIDSISACSNLTLLPSDHAQDDPTVNTSLTEMLSRNWLDAGEAWLASLDAAALALLHREGIALPLLHAAVLDCMAGRCADVLNCLDHFDAGVDQDPLVRAWLQHQATTDDTNSVLSISAYNYLVSTAAVVKASRVATWTDPLFMSRVQHFAAYQSAAESLLRSARNVADDFPRFEA